MCDKLNLSFNQLLDVKVNMFDMGFTWSVLVSYYEVLMSQTESIE